MNYKYLLITLLLLTQNAFSATYTTLTSGNWNDVVSVWSLDGVNPCGCNPGNNITNQTIVVNHDITFNQSLTISNGSSLVVNGSYTSNGDMVFTNSTGVFNGDVTVNKLIVNSSAAVDFNSSVLTVNASVDVLGTVNIDGGYFLIAGGNLNINSGATLNLTNNGKVDVQGGNINNGGLFNICSTCCFTSSGNWTNESSGQVTGGGAATSTGGNMRNFGSWALTVSYCSAGNTLGMPLFENCALANTICNILVLPVEFAYISGEADEDGIPTITWGTSSEKNNDYFALMRFDENEWVEVNRIKGAGNSESSIEYSLKDRTAESGVHYYRVKQVDFDGNSTNSDYVSIESERVGVSIAPNPASRDEIIRIYNVNLGDQVSLLSNTGSVIHSMVTDKRSILMNTAEFNLNQGMYFITIQSQTGLSTNKIIIQ